MLGIQGILGILVPYGIFRDSIYEELLDMYIHVYSSLENTLLMTSIHINM